MSDPPSRLIYKFGDFELDAAAYELRRDRERVHLARQPMEVLLLLAERGHQLVSRDEIAGRLWGKDVFVDVDAGIHTAILKVRQALGDTGRKPPFVETVAGKGYRFVAPVVSQYSAEASASDSSPVRHRHNLPAELSSFIGRRRELEELPLLLAGSRLLTLTGSGGVGKTRLGLRLASDLVDGFPDGVWVVDLGALSGPDLIPATVASALGLREGAHRSARQALLDYLRERRVLLVIDTCEHVIDACAELVEVLLREAPQLRIVATSREALGVPGEIVYRVPSLAVPEDSSTFAALIDADAVRLFIERATASDPTFQATVTNAGSIARICRGLDGIPLAIELAAPRVVVLSPEQIEARLQDRFRLLAGGVRTAVARQRTLAATVEWSYQLLSRDERLLLNRLSVFPASWTVEAAEHVCDGEPIYRGEILNLLSRLVDKSLVVLDRLATDQHRYRLLQTVRDFAAARLAEDGATECSRLQHFAYFFTRFGDSQQVLRGINQVPRLEQLRMENENLRAALEWGFSAKAREEHAVELASALFWYWTKRGLFEEGKRWLQRATAVQVPFCARARTLYGLAHMHHFQGDQSLVARCGAEVESLGREAGDEWAVSVGCFIQALAAFELGNVDQAYARARAARDAADACGDIIEHGGPLMILANVALVRGCQEDALQLYEESISVHRRAGDIWGLSILLSISAGLRLVRDDLEAAYRQGAEALSLCQALQDPRGIAWSLEVFAGLRAAEGDADGAARLWGLSDTLRETSGGALTATIGWIRDRYIEPVRGVMGNPSFASAMAEGRHMSVDGAVALIRSRPAGTLAVRIDRDYVRPKRHD
jgi:predicted ATPase/DNA-binding winged helix-turn-helix (wHTH) protein